MVVEIGRSKVVGDMSLLRALLLVGPLQSPEVAQSIMGEERDSSKRWNQTFPGNRCIFGCPGRPSISEWINRWRGQSPYELTTS